MKRNMFFKAMMVSLLVVAMMLVSVVSVAAEEKTNVAADATFTASTTWGNEAWVGPDKMNDGDLESRWASADEDREVYIEIDFGAEKTIDEVYQVQATVNGNQITSYTISYWDGSDWMEIVAEETFEETDDDATNGVYATATFDAVTTSKIRIDYVVTWGISLYEVEVYAGQPAADSGNENGNDGGDDNGNAGENAGSDNTQTNPEQQNPPQTGDVSVAVALGAMAVAACSGLKLKKK